MQLYTAKKNNTILWGFLPSVNNKTGENVLPNVYPETTVIRA